MSEVMHSPEDEGNLSESLPLSASAGAQLATSRESKGWSVQFVAEQLKLSQGQIVALEADNFDALPKMVIVRGFVRAYAKLLKVDADKLVALLPKDASPVQLETSLRPALSTPFVDSRLSLQGQHDNNRRYIVGAVVLLFAVGVFLLLQHTTLGQNFASLLQKKEAVSSTLELGVASASVDASAENSMVPATPTNSSLTSASIALEAPAQVVESVTASNVVTDDANKVVATSDVVAKNNESELKPSISAKQEVNQAPVSLPNPNELFIVKFKQDSWIQVKTDSGVILSSHLARAGTEESFSVKQTLNVKLGNAAGVEAILRGVAMPILSERGNNVANIVVK
ncbi:helix-turn-helix domain-containing protein [Undibacterium fentianense]|uniref:Helix-turn-helix domain-containing protein n=1 Tax=Undibacterium fentianense TaxID=2828728 RepID=A0A941E348_9BURK|nr:helix-turn-helix domain-containing protein [Undibacterium fentianense]MBR7798838.1 helix-turn-helix domain-containing protein [Undibacterium fentianense]